MDPLASAMARVKSFAKSSQDFVSDLFGRRENPSRRNPIEILKRLQREAFSDLMKLRDRQDKVERIITLYKSSKGGPFQEATTRMRGEVDTLGAILFMGTMGDDDNFDVLDKAGVRPGLLSKFSFETSLREKDRLVAELMTTHKREGLSSNFGGNQLSLAKVIYKSELSDWFSMAAIPIGARFRDIDASTLFPHQEMSHGPPLLNQYNGSALGFTVRKSNVSVSLAQAISNPEIDPSFDATDRCFNTFGQIICHITRGVKISLMGCHRVLKPLSNVHVPGVVLFPAGSLRRQTSPESRIEASAPPMEMDSSTHAPFGSFALNLDHDLDEFAKLEGWIEVRNSTPKQIQWAMSVSDNPEDEAGWGISVGGHTNGSRIQDQFHVESYLKFNFNRQFSLSPGLIYLTNGRGRSVGLMLRSHWSL